MMTSSNGSIFCVTGHLCGEFTVHRRIPCTKVSDAELWCFLWFAPEWTLSQQSWGWWFETPSRPLWRQSNANEVRVWKRKIVFNISRIGEWSLMDFLCHLSISILTECSKNEHTLQAFSCVVLFCLWSIHSYLSGSSHCSYVIVAHNGSIKWNISALLAVCEGNPPVTGQWRGALIFSLISAETPMVWDAIALIITSL